MKRVEIKTKLRPGIKDVQGEAILNSAGKDSKITHITVGQIFYLDVADDADMDEIAKSIFVNDLLYDYEIN